MTEYGRRKIEEAKKNGQWDNAASPSAISEEQIAAVAALLKENAQAYTNFQKMPASVKKTYTRAYLDAKTEAGRSRRLAWMMDRLENNLKLVSYHLTKGEQVEGILKNTFQRIEDIADIRQMTNAQLKRILQKIEVDKSGNIEIFLNPLGEIGLDESVLINDDHT